MPINNDLEPVKTKPMVVRFGEKPTTEFLNLLSAINIKLIDAPTMEQLRGYLPQFLDATWAEAADAAKYWDNEKKDNIIKECLQGKQLPTALETIGLTFQIEGITLQEGTHILRYRRASFSADCSADKWWTHRNSLVPPAILQSKEFLSRYKKITEEAKQLYCDMIDSKEISIFDARYILPRGLETFYFMRMSIADAIAFIKHRIDKQIQPESDNVMAYQMYIELLKQYPILNGLIDIHAPSRYYIENARKGNLSNVYMPDKDSDTFEYNEQDFLYQKTRDKLNGTDPGAKNCFTNWLGHYEKIIHLVEMDNEEKLKKEREKESKEGTKI